MTLTRKYFLTDKQFLTVGLGGAEPEFTLSTKGKHALKLNSLEFDVLTTNASTLLKEKVILSSTAPGHYGYVTYRICGPDEATGGLKFTTEEMADSQPLNGGDLEVVKYKLSKKWATMFVETLPIANEYAEYVAYCKPDIDLAHSVVLECLRNLCETRPANILIFENFMYTLRILHQQVTRRSLVSEFKHRSRDRLVNVNVPSLMNNVTHQFDYLYKRFYTVYN